MRIRVFEKVIDELIAFLVVVATILFVALGIDTPEWWSTAFGMVIAYYFARKTVKDQQEQESGGSGDLNEKSS